LWILPIETDMSGRAWRGYLAVSVAAVAGYFLTPADTWMQTIYAELVGLAATGAIVLGVVKHRPAAKAAWLWFAAGQLLNVLGTLAEAVIGRLLHLETWPSAADVLWLGLYPALVIGLLVLIRHRTQGHDWGSLVDATTITTGLGLLSWVFLIRPVADDSSLSLVARMVSIAYPVGDIVVLAMVTRLLVGAGSRNPAFRLLAGAMLLYLLGDATWAVINYVGLEPGPAAVRMLQMNFLAAYVLVGAAGLHPSVREVGEQAMRRTLRLSPALLVLLTVASLIAPAILAYQVWHRQVTDGVAIVIGSVALFLLVVTRMAQLLRQIERQSRQLSQLTRVDELTGLPNRRAWSAELPAAIERARRDQVALSIALLDLDHFKRFNDEYGHQAGDRLLKSATAAWCTKLRAVDQLARYGGEEFIVLLPGAAAELATGVLERLRGVTPAGQTFSAGVAAWDGNETSNELIARADRALYQAKHAGRDRILVAAPQPQAAASPGPTAMTPHPSQATFDA
jgi:diguanylate cyclase (GGDEF)-like protein